MMFTSLFTACAVAALCATGESSVPSSDSAETAIATEVRAFYRDFADGRWSAMLDHFLPAKVTARWAPPERSDVWARLVAPPPEMPPSGSAGKDCAPRLGIAVVGDWARVLARRCAAVDEAWLLRVSGRWKIVHLELGTEMQSMQ